MPRDQTSRQSPRQRGVLRVYLGAAPGVGKTFKMLEEGHRRRGRGTDVVVGIIETHGRSRTAEALHDLEVVPRRDVTHRGTTLTEMDVDAVLARKPDVALIDEMAHTNAPGSRNEKRWRDVEELLDSGIDVVTTLNIQHLESLNDALARITGVEQQETVPDAVVRSADQIELVDMTPEALRRRMKHGNVYPLDRIETALSNYFRPGNLSALRELALLWVADRVDSELLDYRAQQGITTQWETRERLVVAVTGAPTGENLIRRAARMAERSRAELIGVHVRRSDGLDSGAESDADLLARHRQLLTELGGRYHEVVGDEVASQLAAFARAENATQLVLGTTRQPRFHELLHGSVINRTIRNAPDLDVHVISFDDPDDRSPFAPPSRTGSRPAIPARRRLVAWLLATLGPLALVTVFIPFREDEGLPGVLPVFVLLVVAAAVIGGTAPALAAAGIGFAVGNIGLTRPYGTLGITELSSIVGLVSFLVIGVVVALIVGRLGHRTADALRARAQAEALAASAATLASDDPLPELLDRVRVLLGLDAVALDGVDGQRLAIAGDPSSLTGKERIDLVEGSVLVTSRVVADAEDRLVLRAFGDQLVAAQRRAELARGVARAETLAEIDRFRTALLRAVSHDLRTPLSSIKAAASSLQQDDVEWPAEARAEFLSTIVEESDRLDRIVANLLDASRLDAGVLSVNLAPVPLDGLVERVMKAVWSDRRITVDIDAALPPALADQALLERVIENLVTNATRHTPDDTSIEVAADVVPGVAGPEGTIRLATVTDHVRLRVIDHGPGVSDTERSSMFDAFSRLGDDVSGVGLGLAVANGFIEAMGGEIVPSTTPGGGLTMDVCLPMASERERRRGS